MPGSKKTGYRLAVELAVHRDLLGGDRVQVGLDRRLGHGRGETQTFGPNVAEASGQMLAAAGAAAGRRR